MFHLTVNNNQSNSVTCWIADRCCYLVNHKSSSSQVRSNGIFWPTNLPFPGGQEPFYDNIWKTAYFITTGATGKISTISFYYSCIKSTTKVIQHRHPPTREMKLWLDETKCRYLKDSCLIQILTVLAPQVSAYGKRTVRKSHAQQISKYRHISQQIKAFCDDTIANFVYIDYLLRKSRCVSIFCANLVLVNRCAKCVSPTPLGYFDFVSLSPQSGYDRAITPL